jgi:hypothetical protein
LLGYEIGNRAGALDSSLPRGPRLLRHPHQTAAREIFEGSLSVKPAEESDASAAPGDDDLASPLHSPQILAEAIVQLAYPHLALLM